MLEPVNQDYKKQAVSSILLNDHEGGFGYVGRSNSETMIELEADFQLIATAPELLAALQEIEAAALHDFHCEAESETWKAVERSRAVIAKATGAAA